MPTPPPPWMPAVPPAASSAAASSASAAWATDSLPARQTLTPPPSRASAAARADAEPFSPATATAFAAAAALPSPFDRSPSPTTTNQSRRGVFRMGSPTSVGGTPFLHPPQHTAQQRRAPSTLSFFTTISQAMDTANYVVSTTRTAVPSTTPSPWKPIASTPFSPHLLLVPIALLAAAGPGFQHVPITSFLLFPWVILYRLVVISNPPSHLGNAASRLFRFVFQAGQQAFEPNPC
ncbi:hypothetical protein DFJ73DRAFT_914284 [Zopfochytrium polystomum]|nr:hypothetical protein DFJ73DRAFT_914284 [Zopfochytrium polystomum]